MPKISIIVPIYGVERYLGQCLDSILEQSFLDFEAILVDDGSPDKCGEICDAYALKDKRIRVIHQQNGGVSVARNVGLANARGEFIVFIDGDDYVDHDYVEFMLELIEKHEADIAICGTYSEYMNATCLNTARFHRRVKKMYNAEAMSDYVSGGIISGFLWDKIYRRELFDGIYFPKGQKFEDLFVLHRVVCKASSVVVSDLPKYHYVHRSSSTTKSIKMEAILDFLRASLQRARDVRAAYPDLKDKVKARVIQDLLLMLSKVAKDDIDCGLYLPRWLSFLKKNAAFIAHSDDLKTMYKVASFCMVVHFRFFAIAYKWYYMRYISAESRGLELFGQ